LQQAARHVRRSPALTSSLAETGSLRPRHYRTASAVASAGRHSALTGGCPPLPPADRSAQCARQASGIRRGHHRRRAAAVAGHLLRCPHRRMLHGGALHAVACRGRSGACARPLFSAAPGPRLPRSALWVQRIAPASWWAHHGAPPSLPPTPHPLAPPSPASRAHPGPAGTATGAQPAARDHRRIGGRDPPIHAAPQAAARHQKHHGRRGHCGGAHGGRAGRRRGARAAARCWEGSRPPPSWEGSHLPPSWEGLRPPPRLFQRDRPPPPPACLLLARPRRRAQRCRCPICLCTDSPPPPPRDQGTAGALRLLPATAFAFGGIMYREILMDITDMEGESPARRAHQGVAR
jgi:hypothetical protein